MLQASDNESQELGLSMLESNVKNIPVSWILLGYRLGLMNNAEWQQLAPEAYVVVLNHTDADGFGTDLKQIMELALTEPHSQETIDVVCACLSILVVE